MIPNGRLEDDEGGIATRWGKKMMSFNKQTFFHSTVVEMINFFLCSLGSGLSLTLKGIIIKILFFSSKTCF